MSKDSFQAGMEATKKAEDAIGFVVSLIILGTCAWISWMIYDKGTYSTYPLWGVLGQLGMLILARSAIQNGMRCRNNILSRKAREPISNVTVIPKMD